MLGDGQLFPPPLSNQPPLRLQGAHAYGHAPSFIKCQSYFEQYLRKREYL